MEESGREKKEERGKKKKKRLEKKRISHHGGYLRRGSRHNLVVSSSASFSRSICQETYYIIFPIVCCFWMPFSVQSSMYIRTIYRYVGLYSVHTHSSRTVLCLYVIFFFFPHLFVH